MNDVELYRTYICQYMFLGFDINYRHIPLKPFPMQYAPLHNYKFVSGDTMMKARYQRNILQNGDHLYALKRSYFWIKPSKIRYMS